MIQTESRMEIARGWGGGGKEGWCLTGIMFLQDEKSSGEEWW